MSALIHGGHLLPTLKPWCLPWYKFYPKNQITFFVFLQDNNKSKEWTYKLTTPGSLLRRWGSVQEEEEDFKLPEEYAESTEEEASEYDPDAVYILPVIGEEHIFEKRKVIIFSSIKFRVEDFVRQVKASLYIIQLLSYTSCTQITRTLVFYTYG